MARTIRTASVLVVNDWQWAVFVRDGQILASFEGRKHTITTAGIPILTRPTKVLGYDEGLQGQGYLHLRSSSTEDGA